MVFNKDRDEEKFLRLIVKLTPKNFVALAQILNVKLSTVDAETGAYEKRDAETILKEMVAEFRRLRHKDRQMILKVMSKAQEEISEEASDGSVS